MANKKANFNIVFSVDGLSIKETDEIYNKLMSLLTFSMKDKLNITITDKLGGKHNYFNRTGISPDGETCKCVRIDCSDCPKWGIKSNGEVSVNE